MSDAPSWLVPAFVRSALAVGAAAERERVRRTAAALVARWNEPDRRFHNVRHLVDVLARVDELAEETHVPDMVRLAAWYHGAVFNASPQVAYARRGGEDALAGAELARLELTALGVPPRATDRICELVLTLDRHDPGPGDVDALALCDADLATLAVEPQRYAAYRRAIREEYAHIPERDYVASRIEILTRLLARRRLFVSPFSLSWEEPARENLRGELAHLRERLVQLGPGVPPVPDAEPPAGADMGTTAARPDDAAGVPADRTGAGRPRTEPDVAPDTEPFATPGAEPDAARGAAPLATPGAEPDAARGANLDGPDRRTDPGADPRAAGGVVRDGFSGIEREPEHERRRRRARRRRPAAQSADEAEVSPGSLFRPPPRLPRP